MYIDNDSAINRNDIRLKYEKYDKHYEHRHYHDRNHHDHDKNHTTRHGNHDNNFHSHEHEHDDLYHIESKTSRYFNDKEFINKLLCEKKSKNNELLHNYRLMDDDFNRFSSA
tara:strand:- start:190 stop:525 length:336 start_codon:yes stop_codon:yes gene_type:complete